MERNRQKLVSRDKGSLTEQQTKGTGTTTIQKRGIHKKNCRAEPTEQSRSLLDCRLALPSRDWVPAAQLLPTGTLHDGT